MHLYNLSLQKAQVITQAIYGNFSKPGAEEIVVARGKYIEIFTTDQNTGKLLTLLTWECFGIIRDIISFRLAGAEIDYIVIASDSGSIAILKVHLEENRIERVQNEVFGKTGCRRIVPGQYLSKDPNGRAIMISAIQKQKFVYILDRDPNENLIISSPLEAHKPSTICFSVVGLDVEYENPVFASLEIDFSELEDADLNPEERVARKIVTFYELDLGLNTVTRKQIIEVDPQANLLIAVPGGENGPGGCLVFSLNWVIYISEDQEDQVRAPFPRRSNVVIEESRSLLISCATVHVQNEMFFFLAQSELGDLYKITLDFDNDAVNNIFVKYFDTIPPAASLCVTRFGFLFAASEFGDHHLFTFKGIGEGPGAQADQTSEEIVYFEPTPLRNLTITDEISSLCPIIDMKVLNPGQEVAPQIYTLCGKGVHSSIRVLRYGLEVTEMAVSNVPGTPNAVWSLRRKKEDEFDSFIVVSFTNATLVLTIGEIVEEVADSGFLSDTNTILAAVIGDNTLLQVHPSGLRIIQSDKRVDEWKPPVRRVIQYATTNLSQVAVLLSGGEVVLFESSKSGLSEVSRCEMGVDTCCLALSPVRSGNLRGRFLAVGGIDKRVRLLDLEGPEGIIEPRLASTQMLEGAVSSLIFLPVNNFSKLSLYVGTADGRLATSIVDLADGKLSSGRQRYLGAKAVKLFTVKIEDEPAALALSARSWLSYRLQGQLVTMPLAYPALEHASAFCSEQCPEGVVAVCDKTLRIWTLEKLRDFFHCTRFPLRYTPRAMVVHPVTGSLLICESEHNTMPFAERKALGEDEMISHKPNEAGDVELKKDENTKENEAGDVELKKDENDNIEAGDVELKKELIARFKGVVSSEVDSWGSCVRIFQPKNGKTVFLEEMDDNLAALSLATCIFQNRPNEIFLVVGCSRGIKFKPSLTSEANFIRVYRFFDNHSTMKLFHQTEISDVPLALCTFQGMLLVGVGKTLRLYELGKKKLLRKSENRQFPAAIRQIHAYENRIFVSNMNSGSFLVTFSPADKSLKIFADCSTKFYSNTSLLLDYNTIASGDKFGNFVVSRLRNDEEEKLKTTLNIPYGGYLNSAGIKLFDVVKYNVGETITSLDKTVLNPGGAEVIVYSTINGAIGVFYPLKTREDVDFFVHLESHMRRNAPSAAGRRHIDFRSAFFPVRYCIDGDLCEQFGSLREEVKKRVADEMVVNDPATIQKRVEIIRSHVI